jgi:hypothetical protein
LIPPQQIEVLQETGALHREGEPVLPTLQGYGERTAQATGLPVQAGLPVQIGRGRVGAGASWLNGMKGLMARWWEGDRTAEAEPAP